jgi:hypothetical protein
MRSETLHCRLESSRRFALVVSLRTKSHEAFEHESNTIRVQRVMGEEESNSVLEGRPLLITEQRVRQTDQQQCVLLLGHPLSLGFEGKLLIERAG